RRWRIPVVAFMDSRHRMMSEGGESPPPCSTVADAMLRSLIEKLVRRFSVVDGSSIPLIRRLMRENFRPQIGRYLQASVFMVLSAASLSAWAWLQKDVVN